MTQERRGDVVREIDAGTFQIVIKQLTFEDTEGNEYPLLDGGMKIILDTTVVREVFGDEVRKSIDYYELDEEARSPDLADALRRSIHQTIVENAHNEVPRFVRRMTPEELVAYGYIEPTKRGIYFEKNVGGSSYDTQVIRSL